VTLQFTGFVTNSDKIKLNGKLGVCMSLPIGWVVATVVVGAIIGATEED